MREIPLTNSDLVAFVDDEDFELVSQFKWYLMKTKTSMYARSTRRPQIFMHNLIPMNIPDKDQRDHKDRNSLNNQRFNLRAATVSQNRRNRKVQSSSHTGYKGVSIYTRNRKDGTIYKSYWAYITSITLNKRVSLGYFNTLKEAAQAYDLAAIKYFGEFACTNFPRENYE